MTVYELIQQLSKYPADSKVTFPADFDFDTDLYDGNRGITRTVQFDDYLMIDNINADWIANETRIELRY